MAHIVAIACLVASIIPFYFALRAQLKLNAIWRHTRRYGDRFRVKRDLDQKKVNAKWRIWGIFLIPPFFIFIAPLCNTG